MGVDGRFGETDGRSSTHGKMRDWGVEVDGGWGRGVLRPRLTRPESPTVVAANRTTRAPCDRTQRSAADLRQAAAMPEADVPLFTTLSSIGWT